MGRAQYRVSRLGILSTSAWLAAVAGAMAIDQARRNRRGTGLDEWFGVKRRHIWDDDLLGTALILTLIAFFLSITALATLSTAGRRRSGTRTSVPLIFLSSISAVALAVLGLVLR